MTGSESHISSGCDNLCRAALACNKHQNGQGRFCCHCHGSTKSGEF